MVVPPKSTGQPAAPGHVTACGMGVLVTLTRFPTVTLLPELRTAKLLAAPRSASAGDARPMAKRTARIKEREQRHNVSSNRIATSSLIFHLSSLYLGLSKLTNTAATSFSNGAVQWLAVRKTVGEMSVPEHSGKMPPGPFTMNAPLLLKTFCLSTNPKTIARTGRGATSSVTAATASVAAVMLHRYDRRSANRVKHES